MPRESGAIHLILGNVFVRYQLLGFRHVSLHFVRSFIMFSVFIAISGIECFGLTVFRAT